MFHKNQLKQLELFDGIMPRTKEKILQISKILDVPKGTVLIRAYEEVPQILIQLSGNSIIYNLTHTGKRKILFVFGPGALLNDRVCSDRTASIFCETISAGRILSIPLTGFLKLMSEDFELTKNVFAAQEKKIWRLGHQLKNTTSNIYLERKLASKLWKLGRDFGVSTEDGLEINLNLSITFLADMLGVPRETTSRVCSDLIDYGLIKIHKKRIVILDKEMMSAFYKTGKIEQKSEP